MTSFKQLGLSNQVLKAIAELGFEEPSEIQEAAIPLLLLEDCDFIGLAQTGTGKTAAFGLPLLERIDPQTNAVQALILAPTRELGQQIAEQLKLYGQYLEQLNVLAVYGGAAITNQIKALKRAQHIVIATPGRLLDLLRRKAISLNQVKYVVLDEADEMLNMGFKEDLDEILAHTPSEKYTWLFSATMSKEISRIVRKFMDDPMEVRLNSGNEVNQNIEHRFVMLKQSDKVEALTRFIDLDPELRGVVFCRTKVGTQKLADELLKRSYKVDALHGDLSQRQRDVVMKRFKDHRLQLLIATDVAARGIDVNDLSHVFHFSLPDDIAYYTHRSGRTARAGKKGTSIAFINGREQSRVRQIEKKLDIEFNKIPVPTAEDIFALYVESWCLGTLKKQTRKLDPELLERAKVLLGNLSKEELIAKVLVGELEKLQINVGKDFAEPQSSQPARKQGYGKGKRRFYKSSNGKSKGFKPKGRTKKKRNF